MGKNKYIINIYNKRKSQNALYYNKTYTCIFIKYKNVFIHILCFVIFIFHSVLKVLIKNSLIKH